MRYRVRGCELRSENAAKPASQPSRAVLGWIAGLPAGLVILDYGCGKLRYAGPLAKRARAVMAVDSHVQVSRLQKLENLDR
jgi:hypothetical protein